MCGRYDLSQNPAAIKAKFSVPDVPEFAPNADVRPTENAPIVRLTTQANAAIAPLHDRMPVIVAPERYAEWLDPVRDVHSLLAPFDADTMTVEPA